MGYGIYIYIHIYVLTRELMGLSGDFDAISWDVDVHSTYRIVMKFNGMFITSETQSDPSGLC